jgi:hypothetical protein
MKLKGGQILKRLESFKRSSFYRNNELNHRSLVKYLLRSASKSLQIGEVYTFLTKTHRLQGI